MIYSGPIRHKRLEETVNFCKNVGLGAKHEDMHASRVLAALYNCKLLLFGDKTQVVVVLLLGSRSTHMLGLREHCIRC